MINLILKSSKLLIVAVVASLSLSSCIAYQQPTRPVVVVQETHPKHLKSNNKYKNKPHKGKKHKQNKSHKNDHHYKGKRSVYIEF